MWQETKHGLHKQFNFADFREAFAFMTRVAEVAENMNHHPRWENEWSVVQIWLITHRTGSAITEQDRALAAAIDGLLENREVHRSKNDVVVDKKSTKKYQYVRLFSDGGSRGNPGPSASGWVILDRDNKVLLEDNIYLGVTTNNQAEYIGLKEGLKAALRLGATEVDCYLDSMLVVNQMRGIFKIKNRDLWPIHGAIKELLPRFKKVHFTHVPREHNKLADAAVNRALNEHLGVQ